MNRFSNMHRGTVDFLLQVENYGSERLTSLNEPVQNIATNNN